MLELAINGVSYPMERKIHPENIRDRHGRTGRDVRILKYESIHIAFSASAYLLPLGA